MLADLAGALDVRTDGRGRRNVRPLHEPQFEVAGSGGTTVRSVRVGSQDGTCGCVAAVAWSIVEATAPQIKFVVEARRGVRCTDIDAIAEALTTSYSHVVQASSSSSGVAGPGQTHDAPSSSTLTGAGGSTAALTIGASHAFVLGVHCVITAADGDCAFMVSAAVKLVLGRLVLPQVRMSQAKDGRTVVEVAQQSPYVAVSLTTPLLVACRVGPGYYMLDASHEEASQLPFYALVSALPSGDVVFASAGYTPGSAGASRRGLSVWPSDIALLTTELANASVAQQKQLDSWMLGADANAGSEGDSAADRERFVSMD